MQKKKDVLTTGQVAQICNVAPRTVTKWFDSGQLRGYRIPGSRDRRIPTSELIRFMKEHQMPTDSLEKGHIRILVIDSCPQNCQAISQQLSPRGPFEIYAAQNSFDAGLLAHKIIPNLIFLNLMSDGIDCKQICDYIRQNEDLKDTRIVAIASGIGKNETGCPEKNGFDAVITDPSNTDGLLQTIHSTCSIL